MSTVWIRSQNLEVLVDADCIIASDGTVWDATREGKLGTYATQSRAMEVIGKLQRQIIANNVDPRDQDLMVFFMPKE